jgi:hypothetical protein
MAARSFDVKVQNLSGVSLHRSAMSLNHGIWSNSDSGAPPEQIKAGATVHFGAESDGFMTGCEGQVEYTSEGGPWKIYFDDPYSGSNQFSVSTPAGFPSAISSDPSGNNASVKTALLPPEN